MLAIPVILGLAVSAAVAGGPLAIGATMPSADVKMKNVDGKEMTLAEIEKPAGTLVVFTCNHCPYAKAWETRIVELGNTYAAKGIGVVAVNANDPKVAAGDSFDGMQTRAKERGMQFPYVVDATSNVARAFGATQDSRGVPLRQGQGSSSTTARSTTTVRTPRRSRSGT